MEQKAQLKRWARGLEEHGESGESRAAGRAIGQLLEEVEQLRREMEKAESEMEKAEKVRVKEAKPTRARPRLRRIERRQLRARRPRLRVRVPRVRAPRALVLALVALVAVAGTVVALGARFGGPPLDAQGPAPETTVGAAGAARLAFSARAGVHWILDGRDVTREAAVSGGRSLLHPRGLADGRHRLEVVARGGLPFSTSTRDWSFALDTTPPAIAAAAPRGGFQVGLPIRLSGTVEPGATLTADGRTVPVRDGRFAVGYAVPPRGGSVLLAARDAAGNASSARVPIVLVPRRPDAPVRAVHVSSYGWAVGSLRRPVLDLIAQGRIDAVELDLKDESGEVGFDPAIRLARRIGAAKPIYDLRSAVAMLHARGVRVIGRIVCFRDPILAAAAWKAGRRDEVVQAPDGQPYSGYGGFTNFASPVVRQYQIDIAKAAAKDGVDDILYDYVRRPDGPRSTMTFPGLHGSPSTAIVDFLAETRRELRPYHPFLGASVFGVAATRPSEVAQDIPRMARYVDYIAPMVYPSHWGPGEYGVADPNAQPYDIVVRSLRDFRRDVRGTTARIVPWLQDFSLGVTYGPDQVRAQIRAARDAGVGEWMLWDAGVQYTTDALDRHARSHVAVPAAAPARPARPAGRQPNELGEIPVLMYHQIRPDASGDYDRTPAAFRSELGRLYRDGYRPVTAADLVSGRLDVPEGTTPVVLTFDDSTRSQLTGWHILQAFAAAHPGFDAKATFFVNKEPFGGEADGPALLRRLAGQGVEIGNHTADHANLGELDATAIEREIVLGQRVIAGAVPGADVRTMALPYGVMPKPAALALHGAWGGESYRFRGVFLVGAGPAPSPFSRSFDPGAIPRIRGADPWSGGAPSFGSGYWLTELERHPELRYVSDGDPARIAVPPGKAGELAPTFRSRAASS